MIKSEAKGQAELLGEGEGDGVLLLTSKKCNGNDQQWKFSYLCFCSAGPLLTEKPLNRFEFPALPQWGSSEMESRGAGVSSAWLPFDLHPSPGEHLLPPLLFGQHCPNCLLSNNQVISPAQATCKPALGLGTATPDPKKKTNERDTKPPLWGHSCAGLVVVWGVKTSFPPRSSQAFIAAQCTDEVGNYPTS